MFTLILTSAIVFTRCENNDNNVIDNSLVRLGASDKLGNYLTDKDGNALYFLSNDADGANNCTGGCAQAWTIFDITDLTQAQLGSGLAIGDFNSISTPNGNQLTYKGWPLYYYSPGGVRELTGLTTGDGIDGIWYVAKPDYAIMLANAQLVGADGKNYIVSATNEYSEGVGATIYFTDLTGRTLYAFKADSFNINKYTNTDAAHNAFWPIYETDKAQIPSIIDKTLFNTISVFGNIQVTYKGRPLYYFEPDLVTATGKFRASTKGVSIGSPGLWPIVFKDIPAAPSK